MIYGVDCVRSCPRRLWSLQLQTHRAAGREIPRVCKLEKGYITLQ